MHAQSKHFEREFHRFARVRDGNIYAKSPGSDADWTEPFRTHGVPSDSYVRFCIFSYIQTVDFIGFLL